MSNVSVATRGDPSSLQLPKTHPSDQVLANQDGKDGDRQDEHRRGGADASPIEAERGEEVQKGDRGGRRFALGEDEVKALVDAAQLFDIPASIIRTGSGTLIGDDLKQDLFYLDSTDQVLQGQGGLDAYIVGNDFGNADFDHWNILAGKFGIEFNKDNKNLVKNDTYEQGRVNVPDGNPIFKNARELFLKELSTLTLSGKAQAVLEWNGDKIMAVARHGKGTVFALGDPWLYNEYVDGRKMNGLFQNHEAARELSAWLLNQAKAKK